jgi:hypothetical protein
MSIAVFLDDKRDPPPGGDWTVARTSKEAIRLLAAGGVTYISFDHDLGGGDTGMRVVDWIDERVAADPAFEFPTWRVHSMNPVGRDNIRTAMLAVERRIAEASEE